MCYSLNAQILLEHTFTTNSGIGCFNTTTKGTMFYEIPDTLTNQLKIFNEDYSIYKTITIPRPIGYSVMISFVSEQLFNTDNSIEFLCTFINYYPPVSSIINIYNENASLVKSFGTSSYIVLASLTDYYGSKTKLMISTYNKDFMPSTIEIYSLAGSIPNNVSEQKQAEMQLPFPNPANTIITLPYDLKKGSSATMNIFKIDGKFVDTKQIDSSFNRIELNVGSYEPGIYIYDYNGIKEKFIVK